MDHTQAQDPLRAALERAALAGAIAQPVGHSELLELIVATAAHVIHAARGSLFLLDEEKQELTFEVALDEPIEHLKELKVPLGHGIAGLVAITGQPMAIADAAADPRHAAEIAEQTGYTPHSILCVPLAYSDRIIGVLELLDKLDNASFTPGDMEILSLFARQAAITIEQSRMRRDMAAMLTETLATSAGFPQTQQQLNDLLKNLQLLVAHTERDPAHTRALQLAQLVREIAQHGEQEARLCQAILQELANYLRAQRSFAP